MSKLRKSIIVFALLLAVELAHGAMSDQNPWNSSFDPVTNARFIPVELWTGAEWDGSKDLKMSKAEMRFGNRLNKDIKGPMEWKHPVTGETLIVYERTNEQRDGVKSQLFAINEEKTGLGRVYDSRDDLGTRTFSGGLKFPLGYYATWSGQFEYMERAKEKLKVVVPLTLVIIFLLLYLNFRRLTETLIVMLSVPFSLVGGVWLMYLLDYHMSVAAAVGFIALAGVAAETGVVMLIYLDQAFAAMTDKRRTARERVTAADLYEAVMQGAALRVRPLMMTVFAIIAGLLPIMWGSGTGSEVMRRIAAPMVGGMVSATILTLIVIPAIYALVKQFAIRPASEPA